MVGIPRRNVRIRNWLERFTEKDIIPFYEGVFKEEKKKMTTDEVRAIEMKHKIATAILDKVAPKKADTKAEPMEKPKPVQVNLNASEDISAQTPSESPPEQA